MLNEGLILNNAAALVKSKIVDEIRDLGPTSPDELERAVFKSITGHSREEVDWDIDDNQAGYYTWLKSFDGLIGELIEDGYITVQQEGDQRRITPTEALPDVAYSHLTYPAGD